MGGMKFSANLGFLWTELSLPDAIRAAHRSGFDAVECHWPYNTAIDLVQDALRETDFQMLGLNTRRGDLSKGENGLAALPGRQDEARAAIDEALYYAKATGTANVHVMAGFASGAEAEAIFYENLKYACEEAESLGVTILIEPLNRHDAPNYYLSTTGQAADIIARLDRRNLKILFDCYHVQRTEGDIIQRLQSLMPIIGHIQIASSPYRGTPDHGELHYPFILSEIERMGFTSPIGAEYKPGVGVSTDVTLSWLKAYNNS